MISESDIKRMPINQKVRIMEMIWDDLSQHADAIEPPDWHRKEQDGD